MTEREILDRIWREAKRIGVKEIAHRSGFAYTHLYQMFSTKGNPGLRSVLRIAKACGLSLWIADEDEVDHLK